MRVAVIAVSLALIGPSFAGAESLGEVAAREREKKKSKQGSGRVLTESDLAKRGTRGNYNNPDEPSAPPPDSTQPAAGGAAAAAPAGADAPKEKTPDELRAEAQAEWRKRVEAKNKEIADLQSRISRLEGSRIYADANAQEDLKRMKAELMAAQEALTALDEERRRKGYR